MYKPLPDPWHRFFPNGPGDLSPLVKISGENLDPPFPIRICLGISSRIWFCYGLLWFCFGVLSGWAGLGQARLGPAGLSRSSDGGLLASQKSSFSTGFIRVCDLARCHVSFIYKHHAFLIILGPILWFGLKIHQNSSGFIRYFDQLFLTLQNALGPMLFWCFAKSWNAIHFYWKT